MSCFVRKSIINIIAVFALLFPSLETVQAQGIGRVIQDLYFVATGSDSMGAFTTINEITTDSTNPYIEWDRISDSVVRYDQPYVGDQYYAKASFLFGFVFPFETIDSLGAVGKVFNISPFVAQMEKSLDYDYVLLSNKENTTTEAFNFYKLKNDTLLLLDWIEFGLIEEQVLFVDSTISDLKFKTGYEQGYFYNDSTIYRLRMTDSIFSDTVLFDISGERIVSLYTNHFRFEDPPHIITSDDSGSYAFYMANPSDTGWILKDRIQFDSGATVTNNIYLNTVELMKPLPDTTTMKLKIWSPFEKESLDFQLPGSPSLLANIGFNEYSNHLVAFDFSKYNNGVDYLWTNRNRDRIYSLQEGQVRSFEVEGTVKGFFAYVDIITGIAPKEDSEYGIRLYPNPAHKTLMIKFPPNEFETTVNYEIIDLSGKIVSSGKLQSPKTQVPINNLMPGIYLLRIQGANKSTSLKFIKQ